MHNKNMLLSFLKGNHENYLLNGIKKKKYTEKKLTDKDCIEIEGKE